MIFNQLKEQLAILRQLLSTLTPQQYTLRSVYLSGGTIGGHTRHILELLQCAFSGYETSFVDYDNRSRDLNIERNLDFSLVVLEQVVTAAEKPDKPLFLIADGAQVSTTYFREIKYLVEHTIHHLALIKVALIENNITPKNENLGVAYATLQYRQQQELAGR
jgi:hypothetical protein